MSKIKLYGYSRLHLDRSRGDQTPCEINVASVPMPDGIQPPGAGITLYYGQSANREMSERISEANKAGDECLIVEASVDVGSINTGQTNEDTLADTSVLNMRLLKSSLENRIIGYWRKYLNEEGSSMPESFGHSSYIADRPDLLARLLQEDEFKHISVIIFPVASKGGMKQYATVFDESKVVDASCVQDRSIKVNLIFDREPSAELDREQENSGNRDISPAR